MAKAKIVITLDEVTLGRVDELVRQSRFGSRSQAIQQAIEEKLARLDRRRLARECTKLDPAFEKVLAEEGL
jgi:metal-responsive CopG/Arc/MetJ family transcriptional regulator